MTGNDSGPRSHTRLAVAIVVAAIVVAAALLVSSFSRTETTTLTTTSTMTATQTTTSSGVSTSSGPSASTTTTTTSTTITTALTQPCSEQVYNSSSTLTMANVPVLIMQPNSTAHICVTYQSSWRGNSSQYRSQYFVNGTYQFSLSISREHCVTTSTETHCSAAISNSFMISTSPSSIQPSATTDYVIVVYTVRALSNSTGFYDHSAPYFYCSGMPMAVGFSASQVKASDFAPILIPPCPLLPFGPVSVSVGGMQVTYIAFGPRS